MREMESQMAIPFHQMKFPVLELGYIQLSCWQKGYHGTVQTIQAVTQNIRLLSNKLRARPHC